MKKLRFIFFVMLAFSFANVVNADDLPFKLTRTPHLGGLDCPFPNDGGVSVTNLMNGQLVSVPCANADGSKTGVKFWVSFGSDVTVKQAAALWWDTPGQAELTPGANIYLLKNDLSSQYYEAAFYTDDPRTFAFVPPGVPVPGSFKQNSGYSLHRPFPFTPEIRVNVHEIWIRGAEEQSLAGTAGTGVEGYRFYKLDGQVIYEGYSIYTNLGQWQFFADLGAAGAALVHQKRYLDGRRPSPKALNNFHKAMND